MQFRQFPYVKVFNYTLLTWTVTWNQCELANEPVDLPVLEALHLFLVLLMLELNSTTSNKIIHVA